ncbi:MAG: sigma-54 dependent transcriptional regulator [Planctomycetota bacterium]
MTLERARILVVEDEPDIREGFVGILESAGFACQGASTLREARAALPGFRPDLVLLDLGLPDGSGMDLLDGVAADLPGASVVVITAESRVDRAVQAMKKGARDYLEKPIGLDRLLTTVRLTLEERGLRAENRNLRAQALGGAEILGRSPAIEALRDEIERLADAELPILVTGENGTGKELVARQLHLRSSRYGKPFVAANCAAVPETLIESEFFGHEKGAFTGADRARAGLFLEAGEGTLFLDEIGEMPAPLQARLLRVLQEREVRPVGSSRTEPVRCRFVAATNKDLAAEIAEGRFREDLYYRLAGVELRVPPLRERAEDVPLLAGHFLERAAARGGRRARLAKEAGDWLATLPWPGNVRQLASVIQAAAVLGDGDEVGREDLEPLLSGSRGEAGEGGAGGFFGIDSIKDFRESVEREFLRRKLEEEHWNVSRTARRIGIRRTNLRRLQGPQAQVRPRPARERPLNGPAAAASSFRWRGRPRD